MNPFELTKDQYGSITVRVKSECVVLTREEARRIEERFIGISGENSKLRELAAEAIRLMQADGPDCGLCKHYGECWADEAMNYSPSGCVICSEARELGIEESDD